MRKLLILLCWVTSTAMAAEPSAARGAVLYQPCQICHGAEGIAVNPDIPNLAHQPALAVTYQLIQFRQGQRAGGGMEGRVQNLSDQDARDLGAYLYSLPPPAPSATAKGDVTQGQTIANALFCNSCHGPKLEGQKHIPRLAGQNQRYLERQLTHFKSGERIDLDGSMEGAAQGLDQAAMTAVAAFASSQ